MLFKVVITGISEEETNRRSAALAFLSARVSTVNITRRDRAWPVDPKIAVGERWVRELEDYIANNVQHRMNSHGAWDDAFLCDRRCNTSYANQVINTGALLSKEFDQITVSPASFALSTRPAMGSVVGGGAGGVNCILKDVDEDGERLESLVTCPRCKKGKVSWVLKQTRSADEPMTQMCKCNSCGKEWRQ
jgi:DNA-directed RNA polymerase subunit M